MADEQDDLFKAAALPDGDYAVVELLGHRTYVGRVSEVERFGTKMLQIEPIFCGALLPAILHGGGSIYSFTGIDKVTAARRAPTSLWELPGAVRELVPQHALPAPNADDWELVDDSELDDDEAQQ